MRPAQPVTPGTGPGKADPAVDAYRRAVQAKPTSFSDNPFGAAARTMDRLGQAAGKFLGRSDAAGAERQQARLGTLEADLAKAASAAKANPNSLQAKQGQLTSAAKMMQALMQSNPKDPRVLKLAGMMVSLANQLGGAGLPQGAGGLDMLGMLRLASKLVARYGNPTGMQQALGLEKLLASLTGKPTAEALQALTNLAQQAGISKTAMQALLKGWTVRMAAPGTVPDADVAARTISIAASQNSASLAALAKAHWVDQTLQSGSDKDTFVKAFNKVMATGKYADLARKYRQQRKLSESNRRQNQSVQNVGGSEGAMVGSSRKTSVDDEVGDMFASLALYSQGGDGPDVPDDLKPALASFLLSA